jgi:3-methyladenine DNA glycosylase AlkC
MPEPLKNMYNETFVQHLATAIVHVDPRFDTGTFMQQVFDTIWDSRELKQRMRHITGCLRTTLPDDYHTAVSILRQAAGDALLKPYTFEMMICPDFVEVYGLQDWETSIAALEQFTQQCSAEFAVRPFILQDSERMMAQMRQWAQHENHHVRRLASEGCRPRLPWAMALPHFKADPAPILAILEMLKADSSEYVRRSVANNLNDISKDNPQVVIETLTQWQQNGTKETEGVINHALRTLLKAGNTQALALLGYGEMGVSVENFEVQPAEINMGDEIRFAFDLTSQSDSPQSLMVDYVLHFVRANGKSSAKVFKLRKVALAPHESVSIRKSHSFRPITTRRYYAGVHQLEIQVNGKRIAQKEFVLNDK